MSYKAFYTSLNLCKAVITSLNTLHEHAVKCTTNGVPSSITHTSYWYTIKPLLFTRLIAQLCTNQSFFVLAMFYIQIHIQPLYLVNMTTSDPCPVLILRLHSNNTARSREDMYSLRLLSIESLMITDKLILICKLIPGINVKQVVCQVMSCYYCT